MPVKPDPAISVAISANHAAYLRARQTGSVGVCWDILILTATNEKQARGYQAELALRQRDVGPAGAFFPPIQRSLVVSDPPGPRIGSGGATLRALRETARQLRLSIDELCRSRILLIHSGGLSQRLPAYSPQGKIFAPIPLQRPDAQIATLFDHLYITLAGLPERLGPGLLTVAGDVLLVFDHRHVASPPRGVTALSMRAPADLGTAHGVFVTDRKNRVQTTLQKASIQQMSQARAIDAHGQVLLDTGLLFFDVSATRALAHLAGVPNGQGLDERSRTSIDLYDEMARVMAITTDEKAYKKSGPLSVRQALWKSLRPHGFHAMTLQGHFLHLGTTRQFRDTLTGRENPVSAELFSDNVLVRIQSRVDRTARVFASVLMDTDGCVGRGALIEHSILKGKFDIGDDSVVSQVESTRGFRLPSHTLLFQVPIRHSGDSSATVQVACGVQDDFKGLYSEGKCLFHNERIEVFLHRHRLEPEDLWAGVAQDQRSLWTARLFPVTSRRDAVHEVLWLVQSKPASIRQLQRWKASERYSMSMILASADPEGLIAHREVVMAYLQTLEWLNRVDRGEGLSVETAISHYVSSEAYQAVKRLITRYTSEPAKNAFHCLRQARAWWALSDLGRRPDRMLALERAPAESRAFIKVAEAAERNNGDLSVSNRFIRVQPGKIIRALSPVRLDLSGGWTDTPPHCFEQGGAVVNLAIDLDDGPPIHVMVQTLREKKLVLHSLDLGHRAEIKCWKPQTPPDVHDPLAMHKVAMQLTGLCPQDDQSVSQWLGCLGAGLEIQTECRVPKGSGLGTSSILAATLLAALHQVRNESRTCEQLIEETLILEQRLGTGGGWQDQAGGIVGGVKLTTSQPGIPQSVRVKKIRLSQARLQELQERLVVFFSGQQRLARDILRKVMGRWLGREPAMTGLMSELNRSAYQLAEVLEKGHWNRVAREINRYWDIKKALYPASTTPSVDVLLSECQPFCLAAGLAGAGGGGFGYFFCRNARQAESLRNFLSTRLLTPGMMGRVYQTHLNRKGLEVRVQRG